MNKILLQCDNLCKRYQEGTVQTDVLHDVSFSIEEGEMMAIIGTSVPAKYAAASAWRAGYADLRRRYLFRPADEPVSAAARADLRNRELGFIYRFHHLYRILPRWKTWRCRC